jgi:site-specific DNA-cytosine methylase
VEYWHFKGFSDVQIAVLFDGAGLARLGLERAGLKCIGFEKDPVAHHLSTFVGSGNCILADVLEVDLTPFDGIWASPPCQWNSSARLPNTEPESEFSEDLLHWCLGFKGKYYPLWVENTKSQIASENTWGKAYNAAQFLQDPIQNRNRIIGGNYPEPEVLHPYRKSFDNICPAILATEYKGSMNDPRRASRFYGRRLTTEECAYHQGFRIPKSWYIPMLGFDGSSSDWEHCLYRAIGNGVPVYMAQAFGEAVIYEGGLL